MMNKSPDSPIQKSQGQQILERFTNLLIQRMKEMSSDHWVKAWIPAGGVGMPCNLSGRGYSGFNTFFLQLLSAIKGYDTPVFLTFNQAQKVGAQVKKGEKSFPVLYYELLYKDQFGKRISEDNFKKMPIEEKANVKTLPLLKSYNVFNISQTNLQEVNPDLTAKLTERFKPSYVTDTSGMYKNEALDNLIFRDKWVCPIFVKESAKAFYKPSEDFICVPLKEQFNKKGYSSEQIYVAGQAFYETALHEMAHSTGHQSRLNRHTKTAFGEAEYAKEELVAELSAAVICHALGFSKHIETNNAAYLKAWISVLKEKPKFLESVMAAVNKASDFMIQRIDHENVLLKQNTILAKNNPSSEAQDVNALGKFDSVWIYQRPDNSHVISAVYQGQRLCPEKITDSLWETIGKLQEPEKCKFLQLKAEKIFAYQLDNITRQKEKNLALA